MKKSIHHHAQTPLAAELATSLAENDTEANRQKWIVYLLSEEVPLKDLLVVLESELKSATRFSWLLGGIADTRPALLEPLLADIFRRRAIIRIKNFERSLAKFFCRCGIPASIEGEAVSELFGWLASPGSLTMTRDYALQALIRHSEKYPELRNELQMVLRDLEQKMDGPFVKKLRKVLRDKER